MLLVQVAHGGWKMKSVLIGEARKGITEIINRVAYAGERVALCRRGRPLAVLVSVEDAELLDSLEEAQDLKAAHKVLANIRAGKERAIPFAEAEASLAAKAGK